MDTCKRRRAAVAAGCVWVVLCIALGGWWYTVEARGYRTDVGLLREEAQQHLARAEEWDALDGWEGDAKPAAIARREAAAESEKWADFYETRGPWLALSRTGACTIAAVLFGILVLYAVMRRRTFKAAVAEVQ